ncbi:TPA: calcium-translocating P-type ATPase, PMCA-type [Candidatus Woesearchaeota archaeon]|nr:calcium-translocating P-type ATPase, PMCA-type [Candidatus Woesearchaeota archaeon]
MKDEHTLSAPELYKLLHTSRQGLSSLEAMHRLKEHGPNVLKQESPISIFRLIAEQRASPLVWILIIAAVISIVERQVLEAEVIVAVLIINGAIGFFQSYKAEKAIDALQKMTKVNVKVLRDGREVIITSEEVVPGDCIIITEGDKIPADGRIVGEINLECQEAALTGESMPVKKHSKELPPETMLGDRKNMVFAGTIATKGKGSVVITRTGMETELGSIAKMVTRENPEPTPLQQELDKLGKLIGIIVIVICIIIFAFSILKNGTTSRTELLITAIALAVAAIPEGLPAIVTISLSIGMQKMVKKNALIRKLPSVETLGCTTVICSDKTGTLTKNEMTVSSIYVNNTIVNVTGAGYHAQGTFSDQPEGIGLLLQAGVLCNDARFDGNNVIGDPTEAALLISAKKRRIEQEEENLRSPRINELLFDSQRKRMSTVHKEKKRIRQYTKGAVDMMLPCCTHILIDGKPAKMSISQKKKILEMNHHFASQALRVLGFAYKDIKEKDGPSEDALCFIGMQAMIDPPRQEVLNALEKCKAAGISVKMVTGDHAATASAIASHLSIEGEILTGQELEEITDQELEEKVEKTGIFARVNPEHKLRIVKALQKKGHVVAMTGDGVNDAPALKRADIGIAMNLSGTDVAKEASEMVLLDDNFTSIVNAVEEGRYIFDNIRKFVFFMLSCNFGEVITIFLSIMIGLPLPLIAVQILWMNMLTDSLPALALGMEPGDPSAMQDKPRKKDSGIITFAGMAGMISIGIFMAIGTLLVFSFFIPRGIAYARTMAFTLLVLFQLVHVFNAKFHGTILRKEFFNNPWLFLAISLSVLLQAVVIYSPLSTYFGTVPLSLADWGILLMTSFSIVVLMETTKGIWTWRGTAHQPSHH